MPGWPDLACASGFNWDGCLAAYVAAQSLSGVCLICCFKNVSLNGTKSAAHRRGQRHHAGAMRSAWRCVLKRSSGELSAMCGARARMHARACCRMFSHPAGPSVHAAGATQRENACTKWAGAPPAFLAAVRLVRRSCAQSSALSPLCLAKQTHIIV